MEKEEEKQEQEEEEKQEQEQEQEKERGEKVEEEEKESRRRRRRRRQLRVHPLVFQVHLGRVQEVRPATRRRARSINPQRQQLGRVKRELLWGLAARWPSVRAFAPVPPPANLGGGKALRQAGIGSVVGHVGGLSVRTTANSFGHLTQEEPRTRATINEELCQAIPMPADGAPAWLERVRPQCQVMVIATVGE
jgi:hypothetical protein